MTTSSVYLQDAPSQPKSSAIKAGWICYGIGVVTAPFLIGIYFFPIVFICAVVALCTHEIRRGLILLTAAAITGPMVALVFATGILGAILGTLPSTIEKAAKASQSVYSTPSDQNPRANPKPPEMPTVASYRPTPTSTPRTTESVQSKPIQSRQVQTPNLVGLSPEDRVFAQIKLQGITVKDGEFRAIINGTGFYLRETRALRLGSDEATLTCTAIDARSVTLRIVNTQFSRTYEL